MTLEPTNRIAALHYANLEQTDRLLRKMPQYLQGMQSFALAYAMGMADLRPRNPYERGDDRRSAWYAGWYDARVQMTLGHIFEKYGIEFP